MSLGTAMKFKTDDGLEVELAPFSRDDLGVFVKGFQDERVTQYLSVHHAQSLETEQAWYDEMVKDKSRIVWGIWVTENGKRKLIGNSALTEITRKHIHQATSGSMIADKTYWGRGIASAAHKARCWYAFEKLGLHRIKSAVLQGNVASRKALEKTGYTFVYTERNEVFTNGKLRHMDCLECLNPSPWAWKAWWGEDKPTKIALDARKKAQAVIDWGNKNISW